MNKIQERINLDWLRGAAALTVAALHCREIGWVGLREFHRIQGDQGLLDIVLAYIFAPLVWGSAGVGVFFVISGYVIHLSAAQRFARESSWRLGIKTFYLRRFARLYAVLLVALALTWFLDSLTRHLAPNHPNLRNTGLASALANLLALQGTVSPVYGSNGALWTLAIEMQFYLVYPALLLARRHFRPGVLLAASAVLSLTSFAVLRKHNVEFFTSYYFCWVLGFYAAELRVTGNMPVPTGRLAALVVAVSLLGCAVFFVSHFLALMIWSVAFFFYLVRLFSKGPTSTRAVRALTIVGGFSYTLYAVHEPIAVFLVAALNGGAKSNSMAVPLAFLVFCVAASYLLYLLFDRRSIQWLSSRAGAHLKPIRHTPAG